MLDEVWARLAAGAQRRHLAGEGGLKVLAWTGTSVDPDEPMDTTAPTGDDGTWGVIDVQGLADLIRCSSDLVELSLSGMPSPGLVLDMESGPAASAGGLVAGMPDLDRLHRLQLQRRPPWGTPLEVRRQPFDPPGAGSLDIVRSGTTAPRSPHRAGPSADSTSSAGPAQRTRRAATRGERHAQGR